MARPESPHSDVNRRSIESPQAASLSARRFRPRKQWAAVAVILLLTAMLAHALATQPNFQWGVVRQYFLQPPILHGLLLTVELTISAMCIGIILGTGLAIMKSSKNHILQSAATAYIWFFRGTPVLVQVIFWYNLAALLPNVGLGIPFGPTFVQFHTNSLISPIAAANLGLGLAEAAYVAEIVRGGILGVDPGQIEAGRALGFRRKDILRRIVMPQALPIIIPPIGNEVIGMLKYTSITSVIAVTELLQSAEIIYSRTFQTIPLLIVAALWYLVLTSILTVIQGRIERRLGRSKSRQPSTR
jgi:polar amino acid transport system permease protein